jgi:hypothetical protein
MINNPELLIGLSGFILFPWPSTTQTELLVLKNQCFNLFWVFRIVVLGLLITTYYLFFEQVVPLESKYNDASLILIIVSVLGRQGWRYYFFHDTTAYARSLAIINAAGSFVVHAIFVGFSYNSDYLASFITGIIVIPWDIYVIWISYGGNFIINNNNNTPQSPRGNVRGDLESGIKTPMIPYQSKIGKRPLSTQRIKRTKPGMSHAPRINRK